MKKVLKIIGTVLLAFIVIRGCNSFISKSISNVLNEALAKYPYNKSLNDEEEEKNAEQDILNSCEILNEVLPNQLDDYTIIDKVEYDKEERIYTTYYIIDLPFESKSELDEFFVKMKEDLTFTAKKADGKQHFKTLNVTMRYIYNDDDESLVGAFDILPSEYLEQ